jgi:hypothetical protein
MKSSIFWDIKPCSPLKLTRRLLAACFHTGFLLCLFFDPEDGGDMFLRNGLLGIIYSKIELFIVGYFKWTHKYRTSFLLQFVTIASQF